MKILQVIDQLKVGGAEKVLVDLSNILDENNLNITVLCLLDREELDSQLNQTIDVIYLDRKNKFNPFTLFKLYTILTDFDIIHVHCRQVLRYVGLLLFLPKFLRKFKILFHDHYGAIDYDKTVGKLLKMQLKLVHAYVGVSSVLVAWFKEINPNLNRVFVLENIVRKKLMPISEHNASKIIKLVMVGNFRPQKHYEFALKLLSTLPNNFKLTIIGRPVNKVYYDEIKSLSTELNVSDRLTIKANITEVGNEIMIHDLALHTATSETGPLAVIEYLSVGLPFVMSNTGQVASQIKPELSRLIVNGFDLTVWKENIYNVIENKKIIKAAMASVFTATYSEKKYISKCINIYQNL